MNRRQRRRRTRLRRLAILVPVVGLAAVWTIGLLLPVRRSESAWSELPAPPEAVFRILADVDGMPDWRTDVRAVERLPNGPGAVRWRETAPGGRSRAFEMTESDPPVRLVVRPAGSGAEPRRWIYRLAASGASGTSLEVREEREIVNPLRRAVAAVFGFERRRIDGLTRDVARRVDSRRAQVTAAAEGR